MGKVENREDFIMIQTLCAAREGYSAEFGRSSALQPFVLLPPW